MTNEEAIYILKNAAWLGSNEDRIKTEMDVTLAVNALEKQIPVKPTGKSTQRRCGVCGARARSGAGSSSFVRDTVCRKCFTVIDWSE